ncbi:DISARM system phospholipase D-like protein DrmC [Bradyrhizobium sp. 14AA]
MTALLNAVLRLVAETPPDRVDQLARAIAKSGGASIASGLDEWPLTPSARVLLTSMVTAWRANPVEPAGLAALLVGAGAGYRRAKAEQELELVWTGPPGPTIATRRTEQALLEVVDAAVMRLFVTSFVAYSVPSVMKAFERAIARGVRLSMLLELSEQDGGGISFDAIGKMKTALPTAHICSWTNQGEKFAGGKVHAKIAVADETICFVSSANLTGHAMERNMEAGVLIRGGSVPRDLHRHLEALETSNVISRV